MRASTKIMNTLYGILNVDRVKDLLDGDLHRNKSLEEMFDKKNVVIVPLTNPKVNDLIQEGVMNVNIFAPPLSNKAPDEDALEEIFDAVDAVIKDYANTSNYYNFEISSESLVSDERDRTYLNVRVRFYVESN